MPLRDEEGVMVGASCVVTNVSAQRRAENARRATEDRFRNLFEKTSESIALVGIDGIITYSSPATLNGMTAAELVGTNALDWILPEDQPRVASTIDQLIADPTLTLREEVRVLGRDGSVRFVEVVCTNMLAEPSVAAIVAASHDITGQKRIEAAPRQRRALSAHRGGDVGRRRHHQHRRRHHVRQWALRGDAGPSAASSAALSSTSFTPTKRRRSSSAPTYQIRLQHQSGREVWAEVQSHSISDAHGRPEGAIALISDHTARRRAQEPTSAGGHRGVFRRRHLGPTRRR